jgi:hypothetical protein
MTAAHAIATSIPFNYTLMGPSSSSVLANLEAIKDVRVKFVGCGLVSRKEGSG